MGLWRFEVSPAPGQSDPAALQALAQLRDFGLTSVNSIHSARLFLIDLPGVSDANPQPDLDRIANVLLCDTVSERCRITSPRDPAPELPSGLAVEVHLKPGVMDNVANSTHAALADMGIPAASVRTARRFELHPAPPPTEQARLPRLFGNACIEDVILGTRPLHPPAAPPSHDFKLRSISLRSLTDQDLAALSATGHLFLSLEEMRSIQAHYRALDREPTDLELETIAQTWSEHCVHKTLKSSIIYRGHPMPAQGPGSLQRATDLANVEIRYDNLLKDTIARATVELAQDKRGPECLSVFKDNAGIIGFDAEFGIAFKVETHNHPSAIEPYGGASTGVGGVIRDVLGCGLGAKPIANTDVFCVAPPDWPIDAVPKGVIHPRTVLKGIVSGVRDYGNRMGIPTVNGAVHFDPRYLGNPLVYCGCVGLIPRDRIEKRVNPGDRIVLIGGRTGRDGIHGATFSSAELTDTHEDEFAHAVQIGNAIEEKKVLDVILQARDGRGPDGRPACLFSAITDCGAGGLSSAIGEMAADSGAEVTLEKVPLKYAGLRYDEIWISEAQERMVLAVPEKHIPALLALAASEDVEATVIGTFTDTRRLVVRYQGTIVGDLDLHFLHEGLPKTLREAHWTHPPAVQEPASIPAPSPDLLLAELKRRLASPTTASKHWIIRQYDHEVGGRSVVKPLVGPGHGPADAAVIRPRLDSSQAIAIGCGLAPEWAEVDPYWMAVAAIDEAIRNTVCVGGDPNRTAILDNFCWPRVDDSRNLGALVRACQACYDAARAYGVPFISGKDSLNNEFSLDPSDIDLLRRSSQANITRNGRIAIPCTLLISAIALVEDAHLCITSAPDTTGSAGLFIVGFDNPFWPSADLATLPSLHRFIADRIRNGDLLAAHDCSDGGYLVTIAEMAIAANIGVTISPPPHGPFANPLAPPASAYVVQPRDARAFSSLAQRAAFSAVQIATLEPASSPPILKIGNDGPSLSLAEIRRTWQAPLDW